MCFQAIALTAAMVGLPIPSRAETHAAATEPSLWLAPKISSGSCTFPATEIASADSFDGSTSLRFVNLKDAGSISFRQAKTGCVAGTFYANAGNEADGDHVLLQVPLDGSVCAPLTGGYIFANSGSDTSPHSVGFFCGAKIAPGKHTIQVQYGSGMGGKSEFFQRTLEVTHQ